MKPIAISSFTATTALGAGTAATLEAMHQQRSGLKQAHFLDAELPGWIGVVDRLDEVRLPNGLDVFDCRNNRLAWLGLQQDGLIDAVDSVRRRWGATRIALILGTSTSGQLQTELAYRRRAADGSLPADFHYAQTQNTFSVAAFVAQALKVFFIQNASGSLCAKTNSMP